MVAVLVELYSLRSVETGGEVQLLQGPNFSSQIHCPTGDCENSGGTP